jgi:uncharacterized protein involved in exopolysaccharide biosynthesis
MDDEILEKKLKKNEKKPTSADDGPKTVSLLDIVLVLARRKAVIIGFTGAVALCALVFSFGSLLLPPSMTYLPNIFSANALVMLKSPSGSSGGGSASASQLSGLAALAGFSVGSEADQSSSIVMSLKEQNIFMDQLAAELDFNTHYKRRKKEMATVQNRDKIKKTLKAEYDDATGIMDISYADSDKEFAARVTNRAVELLQSRFNDVTLQYAHEKLAIMEESIEKARKNMNEAQRTFANFQTKYGFYDLEASTSSSLKILEEAGSTLLELENQYKSLTAYRNANDPQVIRLSQQIEQQKSFIKSLKQSGSGLSSLNVPLNDLPMVVSNYMLLKGELTIQQGIYASLRQQYESTQIEEISGTKIFSILEKAEIPLQKSGPSRTKICVIATLAAFFISIFLAFILEFLSRVRVDPEESAKLAEIQGALFGKKARRKSE